MGLDMEDIIIIIIIIINTTIILVQDNPAYTAL